jgi:Protein of unknown function (DUF2599)
MLRATLAVAAAVVPVVIACAAPADADTAPPPPYIDHTEWVHWADLSSLRVYPTPEGRAASVDFVKPDEAWSEVLKMAPDADLPGMHQQFVCHWGIAEFAQPGKTSWNLEPWRPVVSDSEMLAAGCNPGRIEEPF